MSDASTTPATKQRRRKSRPPAPVMPPPMPAPPPMPPQTPDEFAKHVEIMRLLTELNERLRRRNLNAAVQLAIQASRGQGPLVEHFMELGRRFGDELEKAEPSARKPNLRMIDGGMKGGAA